MLDDIQLNQMLQVATRAAQSAGQHALSQRHRAQARIKDGTTGRELVTQVDKQCQDIIIRTLQQAFPTDGFLGEEGDHGITKIPPQTDSGFTWVIDPIDGTNNFAHRVGLFGICVAAMSEGWPVVGVIYAPVTDDLYQATLTSPATCNNEPLHCGCEDLNSYTGVVMDSHVGDSPPNWMGRLMTRCRFRNLGTTALHLALTASGGFAASIQIMPKLWDIAAGALIAHQAGATCTTLDGGPMWPIDMAGYQGGPLPCVVGNPTAHQTILEELSQS